MFYLLSFILLLFLLIFISRRTYNININTKTITYSSMCICIATVMSYIKIIQLPQGGSVVFCSMIFISLIGYLFGVYAGILGGIVFGLIQLIINPFIVNPIQVFLDYIVAFGVLGLSGIFKNSINGLTKGFLLGAMVRLIISTISGVVFFSEFLSIGNSLWFYSLIYNASYILPEVFITLIIINLKIVKNTIINIRNNM